MKSSFLSTIIAAILVCFSFYSCKQLEREHFELVDNCKQFQKLITDSIKYDKEIIYYVALDTAKCELLIRYDGKKVAHTHAEAFLKRHGIVYVPELDSMAITNVNLDHYEDSLAQLEGEGVEVESFEAQEDVTVVVPAPVEVEVEREEKDSLLTDSVSQAILDSLAP